MFLLFERIPHKIFAIFLATDGLRGEKIEYPSKQSNLRHPLKISITPNIYFNTYCCYKVSLRIENPVVVVKLVVDKNKKLRKGGLPSFPLWRKV